jgi:uncharacterized protein (TIGR03067 family)
MKSKLAMMVVAAIVVGGTGSSFGNDKDKIQGIWKAEKSVRGGKDAPAEELGKMKVKFDGDKVFPHEGEREEKAGTFTLDATKSPKTIDLVPPAGNEKDRKILGIYEIDGDTLKLCLAMEGERPTKFESTEGSKTMFLILKKQK